MIGSTALTRYFRLSPAVQRSGTVSVPIGVTIADLGPGIFAVNGAERGKER